MEKAFNGVMFRSNGWNCAIDALTVREMVGGAQWAPLTAEGEEMSFIEIRGKAARVIDLRALFGASPSTGEGLNSFIAVQAPAGDRLAALWVDVLLDLVQVPVGAFKDEKDLSEIPVRYVRALFEREGALVHVLDLDVLVEGVFSKDRWALQNKAS